MNSNNRYGLAQHVKKELEIIAENTPCMQKTVGERWLFSLVRDSLKGISKYHLSFKIEYLEENHYKIPDKIKDELEIIRQKSLEKQGRISLDTYIKNAFNRRVSEENISASYIYNHNYIPDLEYAKDLSNELGLDWDSSIEETALQNLKNSKKELLERKVEEYQNLSENEKKKIEEATKNLQRIKEKYSSFLKVYTTNIKIEPTTNEPYSVIKMLKKYLTNKFRTTKL